MLAKLRRSRKEGFTLIELMIVVAIIGVLIALALPAFINYFRRTKTAEVGPNVRNMFSGASAYYLNAYWADRTPRRGDFVGSEHCVTDASANTENIPDDDKHTIDMSRLSATNRDTFAAVGWSLSDPGYYRYELESATGCGHNSGETLYTFRAVGDLDGDSVMATFEVAAGSSDINELYRTPGMYIVNELE